MRNVVQQSRSEPSDRVIQGKPFFFDDCVIDDEHFGGVRVVTAEEIVAFAKCWDPQPFHVDESAAKASMFGGLTACSAHIFSIFCITSQHWQSGVIQQAVAGLGFDEMRMHKPVFAGDTLRCKSIISAARLSNSKPDCGIVTYDSRLENQDEDIVFTIKSFTMLARDPARKLKPTR
ncbi:MAG: MaoC family dehydratase N-terminal domain-containing protein [Halioglobus sp.]|nr:MaoC family dehydratase N-terminal domain-containing protein [Halioglobus sp.]